MKNVIKCTVTIEGVKYYKDNWGIASVVVTNVRSGELTTPSKHISIKGNMLRPEKNEEYYVTLQEEEDPKWGKQFTVLSMGSVMNAEISSEEDKKKFLSAIFTPNQVNAMYQALPDPFKSLKDKDYESLVQIKGCGVNNAVNWSNRFEDKYVLSKLYLELEDYNLSPLMMKRLMQHYHSVDLIIQNIKENPYVLTHIAGVGFKTADQIAMDGGMDEWDPRRIGAYIIYVLETEGNKGNSYITSQQLMDYIVEMFGDEISDLTIAETLHDKAIEPLLWWNEEKTKIGLAYYRNLEERIGEEIYRIQHGDNKVTNPFWKERLQQIEESQGWNFTDQQVTAIETVMNNNFTVINGGAGCVDCDTEFFTGTGWKRIADYEEGDKVLQYDESGDATLVTPLEYIKAPSDFLYHFETKYGIDQTLSPNHRVFYTTRKGCNHIITMQDLKDKHEAHGFRDKFITTFNYEGRGIDLSDEEIRIMVAIFADGSFGDYAADEKSRTFKKVRMNFKKTRKIERFESLLEHTRITYRKVYNPNTGYTYFMLEAPFIAKHFEPWWYECSRHQLEIIADEVLHWDGSFFKKNDFSTTNKQDADFIQFVFTALGKRTTINTEDRRGQLRGQYERKSIEYTVHCAHNKTVGFSCGGNPTLISKIKPKDGYQYCFVVPSGLLVLRRNNKIFVTGNSGKSSIAYAITTLLSRFSYAMTALSGKAAVRLAEITGGDGQTIHRLLKADHNGAFQYNKDNHLPYSLIIVDEISMIGGKLFYNLLSAIDSDTKVVLLGDTGQLEAIGECNVAADMITSGQVPVITLTKIHRQAQQSAIITESFKVRGGQQIIGKDWIGLETRGEKQDFTIECYSDKSNTYYKVLEHFKKELALVDNDIFRIQILTPMKTRGDASVWELNNAVQDYYNPDTGQNSVSVYYVGKGNRDLRVGDKVINTKNNYKALNIEGKTTPIFNGNMGKVLTINQKAGVVTIDFFGVDVIVLPFEELSSIELGYAITVHKFQGAQTETIIMAVDFAAYTLLTKELIYTGITRAQKKCIVVAQSGALRYAVANTGTGSKMTHLREILLDLYMPKKRLLF